MYAALAKQANHWLKIGTSLRASISSLEMIKANCPPQATNVERCLIQMLAEWLKNSDKPTWSGVVVAVYSENPRVAEEIAKKSKGIMYNIYTALTIATAKATEEYTPAPQVYKFCYQ